MGVTGKDMDSFCGRYIHFSSGIWLLLKSEKTKRCSIERERRILNKARN
jgi:hypothetical protein